jgi:hypothetical protein
MKTPKEYLRLMFKDDKMSKKVGFKNVYGP